MSLFEKIKKLYPSIKDSDFGVFGSITLRDDSDGKGEFIERWEHSELKKPTDEELKEV